jgi:hypothetical protein
MSTNIIALKIISAADIAKIVPNFTYDFVQSNRKEFLNILYELGLDVNQGLETQENIQHKALDGTVVQCDRYLGNERTDEKWIKSGYASREAKDKASGSKLLGDLYRQKGLS